MFNSEKIVIFGKLNIIEKIKRMKLVFATNNKNKIREIKEILGNKFDVLSLDDIGCKEDIPETQPTIEGNAMQKAEYVFAKYNVNCFADDTGLEVEALNGKPGVYSARYAGLQRNSNDNIDKLLKELETKSNKNARFKTVVALIIDGTKTDFTGIVEGKIITEKKGEKGFGYDPVFVPKGYTQTFAEMPANEKNAISHRGRAIRKLVDYLQRL